MKKLIANWTRLAFVVAVIAGTQSGCKSGWKMPGADLFSWSKKPSESTLAGSSPSLSMPSSTSPVSPASKSSPSALAGPSAKSPYGSSSGPSFSMPTSNAPALGGAGAAAAQNGYTNGQYGMVSSSTARPGGVPYTGNPGSGFTAPGGYGPTANSMASANPSVAKPTGYAPTNTFAGAPNLPPSFGTPNVPSMPTAMPNAYAPNTIPAMPAAYSGGPSMGQQMPPMPSSMPNAVPGGYAPSMPPAQPQAYGNTATYRPGSVGRSTGYDFSAPGAGAGTSPQAGYGLPPAVPATANGYTGPAYR